tara:strand:+ start:310 stop:621 length:312 start_codon:yes stop_codon:yes gene_type:complete
MARPKKYDINELEVEKLASYGCTVREIANFFGCSEDLIKKSYSQFVTKGQDEGKIRLRKLQWRAAEKGNVPMLIWLGKQVLGQTDKQELTEVKPIDDIVFDGI